MNIKKLMTIGVFIVTLLGNVQINTATEGKCQVFLGNSFDCR